MHNATAPNNLARAICMALATADCTDDADVCTAMLTCAQDWGSELHAREGQGRIKANIFGKQTVPR